MAKFVILSFFILINVLSFPSPGSAISSCNGPCKTLNDCDGQLICIGGKCNDDPDVGTHVCRGSSPSGPSPTGNCRPTGSMTCAGQTKSTYTCSPPVTASTRAILTLNSFEEGGDGGAESECDNKFHSNSERVVALSTGWYAGGSRCGKMINIRASNGRSVTAKVVDERDSRNGCDKEHDGQPSCDNNIVDGSRAVWKALGLNEDDGRVPITWSMA